jgi:hypothetical protein
MKIKTIEISGFVSCFNTLRKPYKKEVRSHVDSNTIISNSIISTESFCGINSNDLKLLQRLIKNGDEEAKAVRLINVTAEIQAPLFWWNEMVTYTVGVTPGCSESTMHTLKKEELCNASFEYSILDSWYETLQDAIDEEGTSIEMLKNYLPSGYLQTRDINFSYQTLRRIYFQRKDHKLPQWNVFIDWIKSLPLAEELIFCKNEI